MHNLFLWDHHHRISCRVYLLSKSLLSQVNKQDLAGYSGQVCNQKIISHFMLSFCFCNCFYRDGCCTNNVWSTVNICSHVLKVALKYSRRERLFPPRVTVNTKRSIGKVIVDRCPREYYEAINEFSIAKDMKYNKLMIVSVSLILILPFLWGAQACENTKV